MKLEVIDNSGHQLETNAARAFRELKAAAETAGHVVGISTAFRRRDEQQRLYDRYMEHRAAGENPTPVAKPGTSNHEKGTAVDLHVAASPAFLAWLRAHAVEFGFYETVKREPWHWDFKGIISAGDVKSST